MKTIKRDLIFTVLSAIVGFLVFKAIYVASLVLLLLFHFGNSDGKYTSSRYALRVIFWSFIAYAFAMFGFIVPAIRQYSHTPWYLSAALSTLVLVFNLVPYAVLCLPNLNRDGKAKYFFAAMIASMISAFWPNFGNVGIGESIAMISDSSSLVRFFGTEILGFLSLLIFYLVFSPVIRGKLKSQIAILLVLIISIFAIKHFDQLNINSKPVHNGIRVSLTQVYNTSSSIDDGPIKVESAATESENLFLKVKKFLQDNPSDLTVFPEGGLFQSFGFPWSESSKARFSVSSYIGLEQLTYVTNSHFLFESSQRLVNSKGEELSQSIPTATLYASNGGQVLNWSFKKFLIPFIEYVPWEFLKKYFPWALASPAEIGQNVFQIHDVKFMSFICYDSIFAESYYQAIKRGSEFGVVMSNNFYLGSGAHYQLYITRLHSLEFGLPILYVGNAMHTGTINDGKFDFLPENKFGMKLVSTDSLISRKTFYANYIFPKLSQARAFIQSLSLLLVIVLILLLLIALARDQFFKQHKSKFQYLGLGLLSILLYFLFSIYIAQMVRVPTSSMFPEIQPGAKVIVCRLFGQPRRDDVFSFAHPALSEQVIKRIKLLPYEQFDMGKLIDRDGKAHEISYRKNANDCFETIEGLSEQRIQCEDWGSLSKLVTPKMSAEQYFLIGDNRMNSIDSRKFGPVEKSDLKGKVCFIGK